MLVLITGFKSFNNTKAGHLLKLVQAQTITRGQARKAAQKEHLFNIKSAPGLINLILKS